MIDSHCHLENESFDSDRDLVIKRAEKRGIALITSGIEMETWEKTCEIAEAHQNIYASVGLDPTQYENCTYALDWIRTNKDRIVSIGETGLDHYLVRDHLEREKQRQCFESMIDLAMELRLPIQVHSRSAGRSALETLSNRHASAVHLHAFDGKASLAKEASRNLGYYFSIPTSVVRSPQKRKLVKAVTLERLLIETDSPVLGVERNERNEPSNLPVVVREIAQILRRGEEEIRELVLNNTMKLYSKIKYH
jgi:TatD DNase family protein